MKVLHSEQIIPLQQIYVEDVKSSLTPPPPGYILMI